MNRNRSGIIGETAVLLKLLEQGFDAINLNSGIINYEGADLVCINPLNGKMCQIQVKTCGTNLKNPLFPTGFTSDKYGTFNKDPRKEIKGPWVFVHTHGSCVEDYTYYILTKKEVTDLIIESNYWYTNIYNHKKELCDRNYPVCLYLSWITGTDYDENAKDYHSFKSKINRNPIEWNVIWED
ncbi:MAG: hypothetical protein J6V98_06910 [Bacteroidales bacterium]|nr:hypothetical protein [Bacteroidales bacterium]